MSQDKNTLNQNLGFIDPPLTFDEWAASYLKNRESDKLQRCFNQYCLQHHQGQPININDLQDRQLPKICGTVAMMMAKLQIQQHGPHADHWQKYAEDPYKFDELPMKHKKFISLKNSISKLVDAYNARYMESQNRTQKVIDQNTAKTQIQGSAVPQTGLTQQQHQQSRHPFQNPQNPFGRPQPLIGSRPANPNRFQPNNLKPTKQFSEDNVMQKCQVEEKKMSDQMNMNIHAAIDQRIGFYPNRQDQELAGSVQASRPGGDQVGGQDLAEVQGVGDQYHQLLHQSQPADIGAHGDQQDFLSHSNSSPKIPELSDSEIPMRNPQSQSNACGAAISMSNSSGVAISSSISSSVAISSSNASVAAIDAVKPFSYPDSNGSEMQRARIQASHNPNYTVIGSIMGPPSPRQQRSAAVPQTGVISQQQPQQQQPKQQPQPKSSQIAPKFAKANDYELLQQRQPANVGGHGSNKQSNARPSKNWKSGESGRKPRGWNKLPFFNRRLDRYLQKKRPSLPADFKVSSRNIRNATRIINHEQCNMTLDNTDMFIALVETNAYLKGAQSGKKLVKHIQKFRADLDQEMKDQEDHENDEGFEEVEEEEFENDFDNQNDDHDHQMNGGGNGNPISV